MKSIFALGTALVLALSVPAGARGLVVDGTLPRPFLLGDKALDGTCQSAFVCQFTLPFTIRFGATETNQIFAYSAGIVSFGAALPADFFDNAPFFGEDPEPGETYFAQSGVNALVPALSYAYSGGPILAGTVTAGQGIEKFVGQTTIRAGNGFLVFDKPEADTVRVVLWQGSFDYSNFRELVFVGRSSELPNETDVRGLTYYDSLFDNSEYRFDLVSSPNAVPEPATWSMMILGFGMVGAGMRRRKTPLVTA